MQNRGFEIIRFAPQMPEMKSDGGTVAFWLPVKLLIIQVVSQIKDNLVNILEAIEYVIERGSGHKFLLLADLTCLISYSALVIPRMDHGHN